MHIPDGFIAPQMYLPLYGGAAGAWVYATRRLRRTLDDRTLPLLAALTAFAFVVMMIMIPLPGGTTVHASGVAILAIAFGIWTSFISPVWFVAGLPSVSRRGPGRSFARGSSSASRTSPMRKTQTSGGRG